MLEKSNELNKYILLYKKHTICNKINMKINNQINYISFFSQMIKVVARSEKRLYYRDQTPESLTALVQLVDKYQPTKIIELGTLSGMSLRAWTNADGNHDIIAIDLSFKPLIRSQQILPLDLSRVKLIEQNIMTIDFHQLIQPKDRILLYIDAHDLPNVPIMAHILNTVVPSLPKDSIIAIDDLWYSEKLLSDSNSLEFFDQVVIPQFDPIIFRELFYAPYWKGGSFAGFLEVIPLMEWTNRNSIELDIHEGIKMVSFQLPKKRQTNLSLPEFDINRFQQNIGKIGQNPVDCFSISPNTPESKKALLLCQEGKKFFEQDLYHKAINCFQSAYQLCPQETGVSYALAVCFARVGQFEESIQLLGKELKLEKPYEKAEKLLHDIKCWPDKKSQYSSNREIENIRIETLTIFSTFKPFKGPYKIIQRNAIISWTKLRPLPEIILFGNEQGTAEIAKELNLKHVPDVKCNANGLPFIDDIFYQAQSMASNDILLYLNGDIILTSDLMPAVKQVREKFDSFLMIGRRWDLIINEDIDFDDVDWEMNLNSENKRLHKSTSTDYFIFTKGLLPKIPPFVVGASWNNGVIFLALNEKIPVIDVTPSVMVFHPIYDSKHVKADKNQYLKKLSEKWNLDICAGLKNVRTILDANWILTRQGIIKKLFLLQVSTYPDSFLQDFYKANKNFEYEDFKIQIHELLETGLINENLNFTHLRNYSYGTQVIVENCQPAQFQWLKENKFPIEKQQAWRKEIVRKQIEKLRPDIVLFCDAPLFDSKFIQQLSFKPRLIMGWTGRSNCLKIDLSEFDVVLSNSSLSLSEAIKKGAKAVELLKLGFPEWQLHSMNETIFPNEDIVIFDSWSTLNRHQKRIISNISKESIQNKQFSLGLYLSGNKNEMPPEILACHKEKKFGIDKFNALRGAKICVSLLENSEIKVENLFEITGVGTFLLAEYQKEIDNYFIPGLEIETFQNEKDLIKKINEYLVNINQRNQIANAGQQRCLKDHSMVQSIMDLAKLTHKHFGIKKNQFVTPDTQNQAYLPGTKQLDIPNNILNKNKNKNITVTIFTTFKPFKGHLQIIQRNALISWTKLNPKPEIIIFGNEAGSAEIAKELNLKYISNVKCNASDVPYIDDMFNKAQSMASNDICVYINGDIILTSDFMPAVAKVRNQFDTFLVVGKRWNTQIDEYIDFNDCSWEKTLRDRVLESGALHDPTGIDYFVFTKKLWPQIPPYIVGRAGWDNGMLFLALSQTKTVIDATSYITVTVIHQNHTYNHLDGGEDELRYGFEAKQNFGILGNLSNAKSISAANWILTKKSLKKKPEILVVKTYPDEYLMNFYAINKNCENQLFEDQMKMIIKDEFEEHHNFYHLINFGYKTKLVISNCQIAQFKWLEENSLQCDNNNDWQRGIVQKQIETIQPEIVLFVDVLLFDNCLMHQCTFKPRLFMSWIGGEYLPPDIDLSGYDVVLSNYNIILDWAQKRGAKATEFLIPGFPVWHKKMLNAAYKHTKNVIFIGDWSNLKQYQKNYLSVLARESITNKKYKLNLYLKGNKNEMTQEIRSCIIDEFLDIKKYEVFKHATIMINFDLLPESGNIRLFETTGFGVFLLTEYNKNIDFYFEPGAEVETFRNEQEMIEKIYYYLNNPEQLFNIAKAGQKRCLKNYSMGYSISSLSKLINKYYNQNKNEVHPIKKENELSCCVLCSYYSKYVNSFYQKNRNLLQSSYKTQLQALIEDCFGDSDFYSNGLVKQGWYAFDVITNCEIIQKQWGKENKFYSENKFEIVLKQIQTYQPDVVYIHDISVWGRKEILDAIRPHTKLIVGQIAYPLSNKTNIHGFDIIFSSFPHYVERFRQKGVSSYYIPLAFDPRVLNKIGKLHRKFPVTFIGGISKQHKKGLEILTSIAKHVQIDLWGYGMDAFGNDFILKKNHHGEVWGLEMFRLMAQSKITINRHIDVAENYANNMRLYEATGCGALLITDYKDNLNEIFEVGKEVVAYRSPEECVDLIDYYMKHPKEAEQIARAGQERTLQDHTYTERMNQISEILKKHLKDCS
ncbi:glycosyl transferase [Candidatus Magnetomorum sp. HK-1]|nr:glycosyl transferase [Candidatus Magnetomorum sp. HK-1]